MSGGSPASRGEDWDPGQYLRFAEARARPARDLLARVAIDAPAVIYDLGCGAGNVTAELAARWPRAAITGVDSSAAMLAEARERLPELSWRQADLADWTAAPRGNLVFSNAALHWLPDHETLFPRLMEQVAGGGWLAVQMPRNFTAPSHTCIVEAADAGPWRRRLLPVLAELRSGGPVAELAAYYGMLATRAAALDVWECQYLQVLEGENPVLEWTMGSALRPVLALLEGAERSAFLADYAARLAAAYPRRPDGHTLLPFRRLFIVARRG